MGYCRMFMWDARKESSMPSEPNREPRTKKKKKTNLYGAGTGRNWKEIIKTEAVRTRNRLDY